MSESPAKKKPDPGSVWTRPVRVPRASKGQAFTQDKVGATAVALADADGLDAVSMRRVAGELGVTAMSLYWYVDTKDQLVELMVDHVFGEQPAPRGDDRRSLLRSIARDTRGRYRVHPWFGLALARPGSLPGPRQLGVYDMLVGALGRTTPPIDRDLVSLALGTIGHFVTGFVSSPMPGVMAPYLDQDEIREYLTAQITDERYPNLEGLVARLDVLGSDHFESELEIVLDGLELHLDRL